MDDTGPRLCEKALGPRQRRAFGRPVEPVSVYISRATQKLYVRRNANGFALVNVPADRLQRLRFLCHAASVDRKVIVPSIRLKGPGAFGVLTYRCEGRDLATCAKLAPAGADGVPGKLLGGYTPRSWPWWFRLITRLVDSVARRC
jgi:hypothetical protein